MNNNIRVIDGRLFVRACRRVPLKAIEGLFAFPAKEFILAVVGVQFINNGICIHSHDRVFTLSKINADPKHLETQVWSEVTKHVQIKKDDVKSTTRNNFCRVDLRTSFDVEVDFNKGFIRTRIDDRRVVDMVEIVFTSPGNAKPEFKKAFRDHLKSELWFEFRVVHGW